MLSLFQFASKLVTDRRKFQLGVTEVCVVIGPCGCIADYACPSIHMQYLLKYNDVKTKRGVDLAEHLLAYHQAQDTYFKDNIQILNALRQWESKFQGQITEVGMGGL